LFIHLRILRENLSQNQIIILFLNFTSLCRLNRTTIYDRLSSDSQRNTSIELNTITIIIALDNGSFFVATDLSAGLRTAIGVNAKVVLVFEIGDSAAYVVFLIECVVSLMFEIKIEEYFEG
jgi:hypothetical protein